MKDTGTGRAKKLRKSIKKELRKKGGLSLRGIARLCQMKRNGEPVIKAGTLSRFVKEGYVPEDKVIQYAMGIHIPKSKSLWNKSKDELLYCLEHRAPINLSDKEAYEFAVNFVKQKR